MLARPVKFVVCGLLLSGVLEMRLSAQAQNAAVSGIVTDATGAVLAGAAVEVRNVGTGVSVSLMSDEQGRYRAPDLQIGDYEIQASRPGFQSVVHKGITLTIGSQLVVDFSLPVGQSQQTVTVQGDVSVVDTQSTAVGALVESRQMRDLP
ncbi:MAG: carboxypeptidase regulatory-like domain-containing protein, partial [Acidobacteriia bacterium]|nr:carboxypeptidase regulatory-like domain-containing protein [Terriglobia bacterium]